MFEIIEHTADIAFVVRARDKKDIVKYAADALHQIYFGEMPKREEFSVTERVEIDGVNFEDALIAFLNEIVFLFDARKLVFCGAEDIAIEETDERTLIKAQILLTNFSEKSHNPLIHIKAVTHGGARLERDESGNYQIQIIVDI